MQQWNTLDFSGVGQWVSDKVFLEEGLYVFHACWETDGRIARLSFEVLSPSGKRVDHVSSRDANFKGTITVEKNNYYILKIQCRSEWSFKLTQDIPVMEIK